MKRLYDEDVPGGFVRWETEYTGAFGEPWVAWYKAREAEGWEFCSAQIKRKGKKEKAVVVFRRPASSIASAAGSGQ